MKIQTSRHNLVWLLASFLCLGVASVVNAQDDLAKASQNPIANMVSVPLQNNLNLDVGPEGGEQNILNVQPVYPLSLNDDWNLITRTIVPIIYQSELVNGTGSVFGIGDIAFTAFMSPAKGGDVVWGVGPLLTFPTATDSLIRSGRFGAGPSVVLVAMPGKWVVGCLVSNLWDYAGWGDGSINMFTFQPFVNYNMEDGWYVTFSPIITSNWEAVSSEKWTVPLGGGVGRVFKMGNQPVNMQLGAYYNVERPEYAPEWQIRFQITFLFPK